MYFKQNSFVYLLLHDSCCMKLSFNESKREKRSVVSVPDHCAHGNFS